MDGVERNVSAARGKQHFVGRNLRPFEGTVESQGVTRARFFRGGRADAHVVFVRKRERERDQPFGKISVVVCDEYLHITGI